MWQLIEAIHAVKENRQNISNIPVCSDYLATALDSSCLIAAVTKAAKTISQVEFDAIAVTGNSGAIFGGALSIILKANIILVRKPRESSHTEAKVEGAFGRFRERVKYVIVDDFVSTGLTITYIIDSIKNMNPNAECVGVYEYVRDGFTTKNSGPLLRHYDHHVRRIFERL